MSRKSLTLSEDLAVKYRVPTRGMGPSAWAFVFADCAYTRPLDREKAIALGRAVRITRSGLFGADAFESQDGTVRCFKISPGIEHNLGWRRWPGADHWLVEGPGFVLRTQNYVFALRYFARKIGFKL